MLLHRLFENRLQITSPAIESILATHVSEFIRLMNVPAAEQDRKQRDFLDSWPFAPHLLQLLEDQVLVATDAQETRDLIRILANLFKSRGDATSILTSADFKLDDDTTGIGALLDSVANQQHRALRDKALRNLTSVVEAVPDHASKAPHLQEIVGALWLRSIAVGNLAGAEPAILQADITKTKKVDDNAFQVELATIIENSFNIHQDGTRLVFKEEENPQAKVMASARNDRLFTDGAKIVIFATYLGTVDLIAKEIEAVYRESGGGARHDSRSGQGDMNRSDRNIVLSLTGPGSE
jgi:predicted AAA+ superfamily ATPase